MRLKLYAAVAVMTASLVAAQVNAAPLAGVKDLAGQTGASSIVQVQYRHGGHGGYRRGGRGGWNGGGDGAGVAAGIIGGLLLGTIIANEAQRSHGVDYCIQRYRSYDPSSGTYLGYDGLRHGCP